MLDAGAPVSGVTVKRVLTTRREDCGLEGDVALTDDHGAFWLERRYELRPVVPLFHGRSNLQQPAAADAGLEAERPTRSRAFRPARLSAKTLGTNEALGTWILPLLVAACTQAPRSPTLSDSAVGFFGVATLKEDGTICLQIRSEDPGRPVAESWSCYGSDHSMYATIRQHVGPMQVGEEKVFGPFE